MSDSTPPVPIDGILSEEIEEIVSRRSQEIALNLGVVTDRIVAAGGDPRRVRVVGVTKTFDWVTALAARRVGIEDLGENYANELVDKARSLAQVAPSVPTRWHYLGDLQRNKINRLAPHVALFQGIDRLVEGEALAQRSPGAHLLVEVALTESATRGGVPLARVAGLVEQLASLDLVVDGLMAVAPLDDAGAALPHFHLVANLAAELGLQEISMGMSEDLELAVAAGSTMVRIGRALFGSRA